jgi:D-glycero-alpha-D-manno-heptose-7-phosphate kinase
MCRTGGLIIGSTFARYCYLSLRLLPPFFNHKTRVVYSRIENVTEHADIQHPAVRACLQYLKFDHGLEIHHDGDLPAHSGLGSSSSFTVGLLLGLHGLRHEMVPKRDLADQAIKVEQGILEENVGIQDQILAAHGGLNVIEMGPGNEYRVSPLVLPLDYRRSLEQHVLLGFTGLTRFSSDMAKEQIQNISIILALIVWPGL